MRWPFSLPFGLGDPRPIMLAAGGTGGHMAPAAGLAAELLARGEAVALVTDRRGLGFGDRYGAALGQVRSHRVAAGSPSGPLLQRAVGMLRLAWGFLGALWLMAWRRPRAVVGFGGYASMPAVMAALACRIPVVLHEQNAVLGRANRLAVRRVARLALAFERTSGLDGVPADRIATVGSPVRAAFAVARAVPYVPPSGDAPVRLLVMGGSQGATVFSDIVPEAVRLLPESVQRRLRIVQQCRVEDLDRVADVYRSTVVHAELSPFVADVPKRIADVHLAIARSGASTVAELLMAGRPSILVPYPFATDDHQAANAAILSDAGAAWVMTAPGRRGSAPATFTPDGLSILIEGLIGEPEMLAAAATAAWQLGRPDAAQALADVVLEAIPTPLASAPPDPGA